MKLAIYLLVISPILVNCQNRAGVVDEVDVLAQFPGGNIELTNFINKNFEWEQGQLTYEGKVFVSFIVKSDGKINNIKVEKALCETCDAEAKRIVEIMPDWIPAKKDNRNVDSKVILPISFNL